MYLLFVVNLDTARMHSLAVRGSMRPTSAHVLSSTNRAVSMSKSYGGGGLGNGDGGGLVNGDGGGLGNGDGGGLGNGDGGGLGSVELIDDG